MYESNVSSYVQDTDATITTHTRFVGITGLEPAPLFLTPVPKTGRIPITDYIPKYLCGGWWTRTTPRKTRFTDELPNPIDFQTPFYIFLFYNLVPPQGIEPQPQVLQTCVPTRIHHKG